MSGSETPERSVRIVDRIDRVQLALRVLVVVAGLAAIASIRFAANEPQPALDLAVVLAVAVCVLFPDGHAGLVLVALLGVDWALAVDDPTTPWSMALAAAIVVVHAALALSTTAPLAARPAPASTQRWTRRTSIVLASIPPTWLAVVAAERIEFGASQFLVGAALLLVAVVAMWSRRGALG